MSIHQDSSKDTSSLLLRFIIKYIVLAAVMAIAILAIVLLRYNAIISNYTEATGEAITAGIDPADIEDEVSYNALLTRFQAQGVVSIQNLDQQKSAPLANNISKNIVHSSNGIQISFLRSTAFSETSGSFLNGVLLVSCIYILLLGLTILLDYYFAIRPIKILYSNISTSFSVEKPGLIPSQPHAITNVLISQINQYVTPYIQSYQQNAQLVTLLNKNFVSVKKSSDTALNTSKEHRGLILSEDLSLIRSCLQSLSTAHENTTHSQQIIETMYDTTKQVHVISEQCSSLVEELQNYVTELQYLKNKILPILQNVSKTTKLDLKGMHSLKYKTANLLTVLIHHRNSLTSIATCNKQAQLLAMNASIESAQSLSENDPIQAMLRELQAMTKESYTKSHETLSELQEYESQISEINNLCTTLKDKQTSALKMLSSLENTESLYDKSMLELRSVGSQFKYTLDSLEQIFKDLSNNTTKMTTTQSVLHETYEKLRKAIGNLEEHMVSGTKTITDLVHTLEDLSSIVVNTHEELRMLTTAHYDLFSLALPPAESVATLPIEKTSSSASSVDTPEHQDLNTISEDNLHPNG